MKTLMNANRLPIRIHSHFIRILFVLGPLWGWPQYVWGAPFLPPSDPRIILKTMEEEMNRSIQKLKLDNFHSPYFLAYRLIHNQEIELIASYGSSYRKNFRNQKIIYVEARYGDYTLDNVDRGFNGPWNYGPLDNAVPSLKQALWDLTDSAYKQALSSYLIKKARKTTDLEKDKLNDFSREKKKGIQAILPPLSLPQGIDILEQSLQRVSFTFGQYPEIHDSYTKAELRWSQRYLITTEGTRLVTPNAFVPHSVSFYASSRADDGMLIESSRRWSAQEVQKIPPEEELMEATKEMSQEIKALRLAELQPPYAAPAILDAEFTGVFFHEAIGHRLEGQRQRDEEESQTFKDLVGQKIIPEFLSVVDDPSLKTFKGIPLHGHYHYDDEGMPSQKVVLVEKGILKNFLMSRRPIKGFFHSNGHGRSDGTKHPVGRMANLMILAENPTPPSRLKDLLIQECRARGKPYGFILKGSLGGDNPTNRSSPQTLRVKAKLVYRVDAKTGQETLVRGVELVGTPLVVINKIIAAGDDQTLANTYHCGAESGWVSVDQIAPSVLVSEIELQRIEEDRKRPPILPSPLHDKAK
ncbi:MAG: TldD/PmbA family protein [Elusimicrobia bacterium]|nr:TldD/PmbA family protein [Elusimicrobiota bacterium]